MRKLLPTIVLLTLATLAGATNVFTASVHQLVAKLFVDYGQKVLPFAVNLLIGAVIINVAYLLYHPLKEGLSKALQNSSASPRGKDLAIKALQLGYWAIAILLVATIIAPDVLSKFFLGASLLGGAVIWAMQGAANDFICGMLLHFTPKFKIGDQITIDGKTFSGEVIDIGYLATRIKASTGLFVVANRDLWQCATQVVDPVKPKSLIILPPGVDLDRK